MSPGEERKSGFWAFWSSLPGILTGVAGVIAAVGTLAALFVGDGGGQSESSNGAARAEPAVVSGSGGAVGCFDRYFEGIPRDRVRTVEAGATDFDVVSETEPQAGPIGLTFTNRARRIGAIRFAFFPANRLFKIESLVDVRCQPVDDYENAAGGSSDLVQDSGSVRFKLAGGFYELTTIAWGSAIRIRFVPVAS